MAILPVLVVGAILGVVWALRRRSVVTVSAEQHADVVALHRHLSRWRLAGLIGAIVVTVVMMTWNQQGDLGRVVSLVPAIAGLALLLGTIVGELTARPARSVRRTATVETRRVSDILPRRLTVLVAVGMLTLLAVLTVGSLMGSADDMGRAGRTLLVHCSPAPASEEAGGLASSSIGPWPGTFYTVPIGVVLGLVLVAASVALAVIVRRPRTSASAAVLDVTLRRHAGRNVFLALGLVAFGTLGPVDLLMGNALRGNDCGPMWWVVPAWTLTLVGAVGVVVAAWCGLSLLVNPVLRSTELPAAHSVTGS